MGVSLVATIASPISFKCGSPSDFWRLAQDLSDGLVSGGLTQLITMIEKPNIKTSSYTQVDIRSRSEVQVTTLLAVAGILHQQNSSIPLCAN
jgi:hypothetical protein